MSDRSDPSKEVRLPAIDECVCIFVLFSSRPAATVRRSPVGEVDGTGREEYASILLQGADGLLTKFAASSVLPLPVYFATRG